MDNNSGSNLPPTDETIITADSSYSPPPTNPAPTSASSSPTPLKTGGRKVNGKIIATIFGILLLVGGVGAGLILVNQNQQVREHAQGICQGGTDCANGALNSHHVATCSSTSIYLFQNAACTNQSSMIYFCPEGLNAGTCLSNGQAGAVYNSSNPPPSIDMSALLRLRSQAAGYSSTCGAVQIDIGGGNGPFGEATYVAANTCGTGTTAPTATPAGGGGGCFASCSTNADCQSGLTCAKGSGACNGQSGCQCYASSCIPPGGTANSQGVYAYCQDGNGPQYPLPGLPLILNQNNCTGSCQAMQTGVTGSDGRYMFGFLNSGSNYTMNIGHGNSGGYLGIRESEPAGTTGTFGAVVSNPNNSSLGSWQAVKNPLKCLTSGGGNPWCDVDNLRVPIPGGGGSLYKDLVPGDTATTVFENCDTTQLYLQCTGGCGFPDAQWVCADPTRIYTDDQGGVDHPTGAPWLVNYQYHFDIPSYGEGKYGLVFHFSNCGSLATTPPTTPPTTPSPAPGVCYGTCDPANPNSCASGLTCTNIPGKGNYCVNSQCSTSTNCVCTTANYSCSSLLIYDFNWNKITSAQIQNLKPGTTIYFAVAGTPNPSSFDEAEFSINNAKPIVSTNMVPGSPYTYYIAYQALQSGSVSIIAQVHSSVTGQWYY